MRAISSKMRENTFRNNFLRFSRGKNNYIIKRKSLGHEFLSFVCVCKMWLWLIFLFFYLSSRVLSFQILYRYKSMSPSQHISKRAACFQKWIEKSLPGLLNTWKIKIKSIFFSGEKNWNVTGKFHLFTVQTGNVVFFF